MYTVVKPVIIHMFLSIILYYFICMLSILSMINENPEYLQKTYRHIETNRHVIIIHRATGCV